MENEALTLEGGVTAEVPSPAAVAEEAADPTATDVMTGPTGEDGATDGEGTDFSALAAHDLADLQAAFPELSGIASLGELARPERYGELREAGLTAVEACCASHHEMLTRKRGDNRAHLSPSIGRAASAAGGRISAAALSEARELFPGLTDREIETLYNRVSTVR